MTLDDVLDRFERIAIVGGPRAGKTTLAEQITDRPVIHTDDYRHLQWSDVPQGVIGDCLDGPCAIEGVQVARCLRKGLDVDVVVHLLVPMTWRSAGQAAMAKGVDTVFREWRAAHPEIPVLTKRGERFIQ